MMFSSYSPQNISVCQSFNPRKSLLTCSHLVGNYVIVRSTGEKIFETMPIYARIGMHLLFYGPLQVSMLLEK